MKRKRKDHPPVMLGREELKVGKAGRQVLLEEEEERRKVEMVVLLKIKEASLV